MQQVAKILKKAYSDEYERLKKIFDLNILTREIKMLERFKLYRQNVILTEFQQEHIKRS